MKSKIISNYVIAAVAGVGLTVGSVAYAVNTMDHTNTSGGMMGNTTTQTTPTGMHGQTTAKTYGGMMGNTTQQATQNGMHGKTTQTGMHGQTTQTGMHGQAAPTGMHGQAAPTGMHDGMATKFDSQNTPCHAATDSKDKKS